MSHWWMPFRLEPYCLLRTFSVISLPLPCLCQTHAQGLLFFSFSSNWNIEDVLLQHRD